MAKVADNMRFRPVEEILRGEISKLNDINYFNPNIETNVNINLVNECIEYDYNNDNKINIDLMMGNNHEKIYAMNIISLINDKNIDINKLFEYLLPSFFNNVIKNNKYDNISSHPMNMGYIRKISKIIYHNYSTLKLYVTCNAQLKKVSIIHESCLSNILQKDDNEFTSIDEIIKDLEEIGEVKLV